MQLRWPQNQDLPVSASGMLGLQVYTIMLGLFLFLKTIYMEMFI
jgi:hypothetical protein